MIALESHHPSQLLLGAVIVGEELATRNRQMTFASLCRDAISWATETRDLLCEIATDASALADDIVRVSSDGMITSDESQRLLESAREIEEEARTGRIIR